MLDAFESRREGFRGTGWLIDRPFCPNEASNVAGTTDGPGSRLGNVLEKGDEGKKK